LHLVRASILRPPLRCTDKDSWHGHIPFAFWCIEALAPGLFVELGSHKGDSYCAFCQAVDELGTDTRCTAVDTWRGDPHAGFYSEDVYEQLRQYHDPRYGRFSTLLRSSFEEALPRFRDGSVDLLHIDGAHSYEDVSRDFAAWLPKLSPAGVVLLHDIEVREGGFGVWRLWDELRRTYPAFAFRHSHGLGVLAVGASPPGTIRQLTSLDEDEAEDVRRLFARLGDAVLLQGAHQTLARRRVQVAELGASMRQVEAVLVERDQQLACLRAELDKMLRSTSWRVSAPIRFAGRLLGREPMAPEPGETEAPAAPDSTAPPAPAPQAKEPSEAAAPSLVRLLLSDPGARLVFPRIEHPELSIVVVTFNRVEHTFECLQSLLAHADVPFELIVVDNASSDSTGALLDRLGNVTVLRNDTNVGFGSACNQAAALARAEQLLFLNNDAAIAPRSLTALWETLRSDPRCGAVGGRLILRDGRLQEAGGILWSDGTAEAYGRGCDPFAPEFSYRREVEFCSGALLLVRRELFLELGGFDERYAPAYYEDVDLCMGIRRLGQRVLYQPAATAWHHEYGSSSAEQAESLMRRNQERFVEKWQDQLGAQPSRSAGRWRARERVARPRLLVIDDRVPTSDAGSGYPRTEALLRLLRSHQYPVTFFPSYDPTPFQPWLRDLQGAGIEAVCDGRPFAEFARQRSGLYDVVLVSRPHNFSAVRRDLARSFPRAVVIYDAEALFFVREEQKGEIQRNAAADELAQRQQQELDLLRFAHLVVTVSDRERRLLEQAAPDFRGQIAVWGYPIEARPTPRSFRERRDLLFLGSFFGPLSPNRDAVPFFVREVLPLIELDCRLRVVGHGAREAVGDCASARVEIVGYVEDVTPYYDACRVFVVPHPYSAGIPLKLCEAMARGVPAVVSELTALQLGVEDGCQVLVGRTPQELAEKVVKLYSDEVLWQQLRANALEFVRRRHDPAVLGQALDEIVAGALAAGPSEPS
jgi:GT2 family glycosyltransferase